MRLGVLGPANDNLIGLSRAAQYLVDEAQADRVMYVAEDDALDRVVVAWAREIVGGNPAEEVLFKRAAARCAKATSDEIDRFVEREQARLRLKVFVSLPGAMSRTIEILDGRVVLFVDDKATLDEEDIAAASLVVFGKSAEPMIKRVGSRIFVAPGPIGEGSGGSVLLDDAGGGIRIEIISATGAVTAQDHLGGVPSSRMRVQGGS
jgi:hypothetical protein